MNNLSSFTLSGPCDPELIKSSLNFIGKNLLFDLDGFCYLKMEQFNDEPVLAFCNYETNIPTYKPFHKKSIDISDDIDSMLVTSLILDFIRELDDKQLTNFECSPSGYEEDYEIGWEIFIPDSNIPQHHITDFYYSPTEIAFAVRPKFLEYGK